METLAQIQKAEDERLDRAARYGRLLDEQTRLRKTVARLRGRQTPDLDALLQVRELAATVDVGLRAKSGHLIRDILVDIATQGIAQSQLKSQTLSADLHSAEEQLASIDEALTEFKE